MGENPWIVQVLEVDCRVDPVPSPHRDPVDWPVSKRPTPGALIRLERDAPAFARVEVPVDDVLRLGLQPSCDYFVYGMVESYRATDEDDVDWTSVDTHEVKEFVVPEHWLIRSMTSSYLRGTPSGCSSRVKKTRAVGSCNSEPLVVERRSQTSEGGWSPWKQVHGSRLVYDSLRVFLDPAGNGVIEVQEVGENVIQYGPDEERKESQ
jgi:hypothetical protein